MTDTYTFSPANSVVGTSVSSPVFYNTDRNFLASLPNCSYGSSRSLSHRVLSAEFGDGYSQRTADGLNTAVESWDVTWNNLTLANGRLLTKYLSTRRGYRSFKWTPPNEARYKVWICESFSDQPVTYNVRTISAKFKRVYDLL